MDKDFGELLRKMYAADICLIGIVPPAERIRWDSLTTGEVLRFAQKGMMAMATLSGADLRKWSPLRAEQFARWKLQQYQQPWVGPAVDSLDPKREYQVLLNVEEAGSCEENGIHPRYQRFFQETDFEEAVSRFVLQKGLAGPEAAPVATQTVERE